MNITKSDTAEIRQLFSNLIGEVTAKRLFVGYGLFQQKDMFAIYDSGKIYLRAKQDFAKELEKYGAVSWGIYQTNEKLNVHHYYRLPQAITENLPLYKECLTKALDQIREEKLNIALSNLNKIRKMVNLSIKYERLLAKVDVLTINEFKMLGAVNCYVRLLKNDLVCGLEIFWKLSGALINKRAEIFSKKEKEDMLRSLNMALKNAGLKTIEANLE